MCCCLLHDLFVVLPPNGFVGASHDSVIASRCDRVVKLGDGRIVDDVAVTATAATSETLDRITRWTRGPDPGWSHSVLGAKMIG